MASMNIKDLNGKTVCILGFGREGQATARALEKYASKAKITIADSNIELRITNYESQLGPDYLKNINRFDVIIKSPGIPPSVLEPTTYHLLTSATPIFFDTIANTNASVIGVTGSKGKSTTSSLIYEILKAAGKDAHLIGNIGKPALDYLDLAKDGPIFVMEMSSYQLMDMTVSPHIAVITSFFPEHLDYHGSFDAYKEAKKHITKYQTSGDVAIFNRESSGAVEIANESNGKKIPFSTDDSPVLLEKTHLLGRHNLSNIAAAWTVSQELGIAQEIAVAAITTFHGLPHRLQSLGMHNDIEWIDDAISTTPESTMAALEALGDRVETIILGGQDRGNDFTKLGEAIAQSKIQTVILFPGSGPRIREALEKAQVTANIFEASSMQEAVKLAKLKTKNQKPNTSPIILLSTASPSYNMFKNFEEKGLEFQRCLGLL